MITSILAAGLLLLTFDDASYDDWLRQLPLFARYDAHATFFPCGTLTTNEVAKLRQLDAAGHTIGLHTVHHRDADRAFREEGWWNFWRREINPQLAAAAAGGLKIRYMAYPNNRHSPMTDAWLARNFIRFRAGVRGMTGYHTNGTSIVSIDRAFFPVADLPKHRVLCGTGVGSYYSTDIDDLCLGIRRAAERDEVFVLYSHDISMSPCPVGMKTEWLEKLLKTAKACGVPVRGFKELPPPAPCTPDKPMTIYLTFDDGIKDHLTIAAGELEKRGWRGIFSITTDRIGRDGSMTWDDVRELQRRGHVIANHTRAHGDLGDLCQKGKAEIARRDILDGAERLEKETRRRPTLLCLPGTDGDARVTQIAREAGMTTMLVPRVSFGAWPQDVRHSINFLRGCGMTRVDFLVHGIRKGGGGWQPFATKEDFFRYLDGIKEAEKDGKVVVSSDYPTEP